MEENITSAIKKSEVFDVFLKENNIDCFTKEEQKDDVHTVFYRSSLDTNIKKLPIYVVFDDSIYTMIRVVISSDKVDLNKKAAIDEYLSGLNAALKPFKYYVAADMNGIIMDVCIPVFEDDVNPVLYTSIISELIVPYFETGYAEIVEKCKIAM